ncbi:MAG: hypothetical protein ACPG43_07795 [Alcanivoracaceae bacterium]
MKNNIYQKLKNAFADSEMVEKAEKKKGGILPPFLVSSNPYPIALTSTSLSAIPCRSLCNRPCAHIHGSKKPPPVRAALAPCNRPLGTLTAIFFVYQ